MAFRDDHDAALARIAALEAEVARRDDQIEALRHELEAARAEAKREPGPPSRLGLVAVFGAIVAAVIVAVVVIAGRRDEAPETHVGAASSAGATFGPAYADDLTTSLAEAYAERDRTMPGTRLVSIRADGIDADGRLDAMRGVLELQFQRLDPLSCVTLRRRPSGWERDNGMCHHLADAELHPRCTFRAIWAMALAQGVPADVLAYISHDVEGWGFHVDDRVRFHTKYYGDDCPPPL